MHLRLHLIPGKDQNAANLMRQFLLALIVLIIGIG
jgi:hypothetical protein